jgi:lysophospholipase L1-like esterase
LLFLVVLELAARITGVEHAIARRVTQRMYPITPETGGTYSPFATRVYDPLLSWRLRPGALLPTGGRARINSYGFVGREFDWRKRPGTTRVLSLGDSVTYGLWACKFGLFCHDDPYPEALEKMAGRAGLGSVEVIDAGVYGYDSLQGLRYYRSYLGGLDADIVTVMFGWNDHGSGAGSPGREPRNPVLRAISHASVHFAAYRSLAGLVAWTRAGYASRAPQIMVGQHVPRVSLEDFAYHLEELVRLAQSRGARILLITEPVGLAPEDVEPQPWRFEGLASYQEWSAEHARYNAVTRSVGARLAVPVVDAAAVFERNNRALLFDPYDLVHPNRAGHAQIAQLLLERMLWEGWLNSRAR